MVSLNPLATGLLEGTLLSLLGVILFQLRHRASLIPYVFFLGGLALTIPFTAHLTPLELAAPWTISRAYAVVLPVFVSLVVLLHTFIGTLEARVAAGLPVLGGALVAAATLASRFFTVVLPENLLPSATQALLAGGILAVAAITATTLFEFWHAHVTRASPFLVLVTSSLAGVLVHGLVHQGVSLAGIALPGGTWPAIAAVPLVTGLAPVAFVTVYAHVLLDDLKPIAGVEPSPASDARSRDLETVREAEDRYQEALAWARTANEMLEEQPGYQQVGMFVADPQGRVLHANEATGWMLGRAPKELMGQPLGQLFADEGLPDPDADPDQAGAEGHRTVHVRLPDGRERDLEVEIVRTPSGAFRGELKDVTATTLRDEAQRHRQRARFALGLLGRDLPNYLAAPRSAAQALAERAAGAPEANGLGDLAQRVDNGLADIQEVLGRVRPLHEIGRAQQDTIDLVGMLREAVRDLPHETLEGVSVRWQTPSGEAPALGCRLLPIAFREILENASEHAGPDAQVTIRLAREDATWMIQFDDDGPGVPAEHKERIFEGFAASSDGRGAGIGLSLARTIVQGCQGRVWVEDRIPGQPENGASFRVALPAETSAPETLPIDLVLREQRGPGSAPGSQPTPA